ncbi:MAG: GHMP kinase, partial [Myxococcota bacterium]|nr:GHMP kinase [Myxococcota bacterium]
MSTGFWINRLFIPGRVCLFGEHSDWAGGYRNENPDLGKGHAIIAPTTQGIYAESRPTKEKLVLHSCDMQGTTLGSIEIPMECKCLQKVAESDHFFSYAAGVAYELLQHYPVKGMHIHNYKSDLPIKKGLSSSAALCVLVTRAFNAHYGLGLSLEEEMQIAYKGERNTGSSCGRMDQACAFEKPVYMTFDGDLCQTVPLSPPTTIYMVLVDLKASKNTRRILSDLQKGYPFAQNQQQRNVQSFLGPLNEKITQSAVQAIQKGALKELGELMNLAQELFDLHLEPACPSELSAPKLHSVLRNPLLKPHILGGKGVGSQGDGSAQFLVKDEQTQADVMDIIENQLGLS